MSNFTRFLSRLNPVNHFFRYLFDRILGKFILNDIDMSKIDLKECRLHQLNLNSKQINELFLKKSPISLIQGSIKQLEIKVPWKSMFSDSIEISVDGVDLLFEFNQNIYKSEFIDECIVTEFQKLKVIIEEKFEEALPSDEMNTLKTFINQILLNIKFQLKSLTVRICLEQHIIKSPCLFLRVDQFQFQRISENITTQSIYLENPDKYSKGTLSPGESHFKMELNIITLHLLDSDTLSINELDYKTFPEYKNNIEPQFPYNYPPPSHPNTIFCIGMQKIQSNQQKLKLLERRNILVEAFLGTKRKFREILIQLPVMEVIMEPHQLFFLSLFIKKFLKWNTFNDYIKIKSKEKYFESEKSQPEYRRRGYSVSGVRYSEVNNLGDISNMNTRRYSFGGEDELLQNQNTNNMNNNNNRNQQQIIFSDEDELLNDFVKDYMKNANSIENINNVQPENELQEIIENINREIHQEQKINVDQQQQQNTQITKFILDIPLILVSILKKDVEYPVMRSWILQKNPYRLLSKGKPKIFNDKIPGSHFNIGVDTIEIQGTITPKKQIRISLTVSKLRVLDVILINQALNKIFEENNTNLMDSLTIGELEMSYRLNDQFGLESLRLGAKQDSLFESTRYDMTESFFGVRKVTKSVADWKLDEKRQHFCLNYLMKFVPFKKIQDNGGKLFQIKKNEISLRLFDVQPLNVENIVELNKINDPQMQKENHALIIRFEIIQQQQQMQQQIQQQQLIEDDKKIEVITANVFSHVNLDVFLDVFQIMYPLNKMKNILNMYKADNKQSGIARDILSELQVTSQLDSHQQCNIESYQQYVEEKLQRDNISISVTVPFIKATFSGLEKTSQMFHDISSDELFSSVKLRSSGAAQYELPKFYNFMKNSSKIPNLTYDTFSLEIQHVLIGKVKSSFMLFYNKINFQLNSAQFQKQLKGIYYDLLRVSDCQDFMKDKQQVIMLPSIVIQKYNSNSNNIVIGLPNIECFVDLHRIKYIKQLIEDYQKLLKQKFNEMKLIKQEFENIFNEFMLLNSNNNIQMQKLNKSQETIKTESSQSTLGKLDQFNNNNNNKILNICIKGNSINIYIYEEINKEQINSKQIDIKIDNNYFQVEKLDQSLYHSVREDYTGFYQSINNSFKQISRDVIPQIKFSSSRSEEKEFLLFNISQWNIDCKKNDENILDISIKVYNIYLRNSLLRNIQWGYPDKFQNQVLMNQEQIIRNEFNKYFNQEDHTKIILYRKKCFLQNNFNRVFSDKLQLYLPYQFRYFYHKDSCIYIYKVDEESTLNVLPVINISIKNKQKNAGNDGNINQMSIDNNEQNEVNSVHSEEYHQSIQQNYDISVTLNELVFRIDLDLAITINILKKYQSIFASKQKNQITEISQKNEFEHNLVINLNNISIDFWPYQFQKDTQKDNKKLLSQTRLLITVNKLQSQISKSLKTVNLENVIVHILHVQNADLYPLKNPIILFYLRSDDTLLLNLGFVEILSHEYTTVQYKNNKLDVIVGEIIISFCDDGITALKQGIDSVKLLTKLEFNQASGVQQQVKKQQNITTVTNNNNGLNPYCRVLHYYEPNQLQINNSYFNSNNNEDYYDNQNINYPQQYQQQQQQQQGKSEDEFEIIEDEVQQYIIKQSSDMECNICFKEIVVRRLGGQDFNFDIDLRFINEQDFRRCLIQSQNQLQYMEITPEEDYLSQSNKDRVNRGYFGKDSLISQQQQQQQYNEDLSYVFKRYRNNTRNIEQKLCIGVQDLNTKLITYQKTDELIDKDLLLSCIIVIQNIDITHYSLNRNHIYILKSRDDEQEENKNKKCFFDVDIHVIRNKQFNSYDIDKFALRLNSIDINIRKEVIDIIETYTKCLKNDINNSIKEQIDELIEGNNIQQQKILVNEDNQLMQSFFNLENKFSDNITIQQQQQQQQQQQVQEGQTVIINNNEDNGNMILSLPVNNFSIQPFSIFISTDPNQFSVSEIFVSPTEMINFTKLENIEIKFKEIYLSMQSNLQLCLINSSNIWKKDINNRNKYPLYALELPYLRVAKDLTQGIFKLFYHPIDAIQNENSSIFEGVQKGTIEFKNAIVKQDARLRTTFKDIFSVSKQFIIGTGAKNIIDKFKESKDE